MNSGKDSNENEIDDEPDSDDEKSLQQVDIKMLQVDWLIEDKLVGRRFIEALCSNNDCLRLFESETVKYFTDYLWKETFSYFVI